MKKLKQKIRRSNIYTLKTTGLLFMLLIFENSILAQNLIQNSSFEYSSNVNCSSGTHSLTSWFELASPDYFTTQCTGNYGNPINLFGISSAVSGNSYMGIIAYHKSAEYKEYIQQHLNSPLNSNQSYYVSFYVSRADGMLFSIKQLGCFISTFQPILSQSYITAIPQIQNQNNFITDTSAWIKIEGYYRATGGEQYITIGNFNSNSNTDTLRSGSINPTMFEPPQAYYYIDSVSLYDSISYVTDIEKYSRQLNLAVFPNPTNGSLKISIKNLKETEELNVIVTDIWGRKTKEIEYQAEIDISDYAKGFYFISIYKDRLLLANRKIVKE